MIVGLLDFLVSCCWGLQILSCAKYGGRHTVTLLTGDGVGPEILAHLQEVFRQVSELRSNYVKGFFVVNFLKKKVF